MRNKKERIAFLLKIGSASEKIGGITHLFEHLLIKQFNQRIVGFTTEDYIYLHSQDVSLSELIDQIKKYNIADNILEKQKNKLIFEIKLKKNMPEELFFRKIWNNTIYEKSPLGKEDEVEKIIKDDIDNLKSIVLDKNILTYDEYKKVVNADYFNNIDINKMSPNSFNPIYCNIINIKNVNCNTKKKKALTKYFFYRSIKNATYLSIIMDHGWDILYLLAKLLQIYNPKKIIQFCKKQKLGAFFYEIDCLFPKPEDVFGLKKLALEKINEEFGLVENSFIDLALNELESNLYYQNTLKERKRLINNICENEIINSLDKIKYKASQFKEADQHFSRV